MRPAEVFTIVENIAASVATGVCHVNIRLLCLSTSESEREFIGTNIKQFHAKIKLRRWDT